jgi:hypothetical protein
MVSVSLPLAENSGGLHKIMKINYTEQIRIFKAQKVVIFNFILCCSAGSDG